MNTVKTLIKQLENKPAQHAAVLHLLEFYTKENPNKNINTIFDEIINPSLSPDEIIGDVPEQNKIKFLCDGITLLQNAIEERTDNFELNTNDFTRNLIKEFHCTVREILCELIK